MGLHTHYMGMSGPALRAAIALTAGLCFIAFGYGQGDIGGLMIMTSFRDKFPQMDITGNPGNLHIATMSGIVVATWNLGCVVGAFFTIFIGDWLGRKGTIMLGLGFEIIGKIIQCSSFTMGQYIAGRFIAGFGNGFITSTIPAWQAETLKTHRRGTLLMVSFGACLTFGLALSYWFVYAFSFTQPSAASWRVPIALSMLFILPALLLISFLPESPRWLLLQAREQEAVSVLSALNELPEDSEDVRREILQIKNAVIYMAKAPANRVFSNGDYRYLQRTLLAIGLQVMQQFTGVNLFMQYLGGMFANQLHFEARLSMLLASCCTSEFFLASFVAVIGIDRFWGRRTLTIFGATGMCICMIVLSAMDWYGAAKKVTSAYYVMAVFLFLYNTFFSIGWQGMSWMWAVELIPLSIRGPANALSTAANWLSNFIVVMVTPVIFTTSTYRTYILFAVTNFVIVPIIYFFYPETGSRSLEEVDVLFKAATEKGKPTFSVVQVARTEPRWYDKNGEPTDSYASTEGDSADLEKGSAKGDDHSSPDSYWRNITSSSEPPDVGDEGDAAPAPSIRRTQSAGRDARRSYDA